MSIEYRADARLQQRQVAALIEGLAREDEWSVVSRGERDLVLRWAAHLGEDAQSDATIEVEPNSVYLAVHAGTRRQRDVLVQLMTEILRAIGVAATFRLE